MENNEKKPKKGLKILGFILLAAAIGCIITAFVNFFTSIFSAEMPKLFWMFFIAFPLIPVSIILMAAGSKKPTQNITAVPMATNNDIIELLKDSAKNKDVPEYCSFCGAKNSDGEKSCHACGAAFVEDKKD